MDSNYYLVDKFNRGYGKSPDSETKRVIEYVYKDYTASHKKLSERIALIEEIRKKYDVTDSYFSTKKRRIVSVKPAINDNDVIIKQQLLEVGKLLDRKITDHINDFNKFKDSLK